MAKPDRFSRLRRLAHRPSQRGYFTAAQAKVVGIPYRELSLLVARGAATREARGLYRFTVSAAPTWKDALAGELLATGGTACGLSSCALFGLVDPPPRPKVLVPRGSRNVRPGRHTTRELPDDECTTVDGLRTLAPTRAVLDSVHRLPRHKAKALVESAIVKGLVDPDRLRKRALELTNPKRPGCAMTVHILDELHPELARSRNEWEALVARRAKEHGLPRPALEHDIIVDGRRYIADAAWPEVKVMLEFDGRDPHMRRKVHDNDSVRRNDLTSAGWLRFGITAALLKNRDDRVLVQVARAIALRSIA